ncbi:hypothetical protein PR202_ga05403 [Eleusine coracana subsp. coracana]|uniref:DUF1618 domain-containing protein n=1 Tax=Eleusine coracana subsp. coracana TaxID=191504 RepID=A0AAV5BTE9_ELECO|nr:hypothetical protein PR202_ga04950 [Eleusine coracana subsp. coracana]GJM89234.1 hypothetical protein PR202_ga05403 [Eleusine coracana subsp. coracana]
MLPLRRLLGLSAAAVSINLRRGISTAASLPAWAMIHPLARLTKSPEPRAFLRFAEPPCASHLIVPAHLAEHPATDPYGDDICLIYGGLVKATSGDGLVLLSFMDIRATAPIVSTHGDTQERKITGVDLDVPITRFVCNPLSGQMFRLPDIDGMKKTGWVSYFGILTQSERPDRPTHRYAVAVITEDGDGEDRSFVMRRFLSQKGEWEKLEGLPSPLPLARSMNIEREVVAFAGRLWWVDVGWGAVSADPFSDRPDLRFVELPRGSVTEPVDEAEARRRRHDDFRFMGVREGRLRYAEVSQEMPFLLSSFALDDDGSCWTLEHRVVLSRILPQGNYLRGKDSPRIGFVDPLDASLMHLTVDNQVFSVDMDGRKVLSCSMRAVGAGLSCLLQPWLGSSRIPSPGDHNLSPVLF